MDTAQLIALLAVILEAGDRAHGWPDVAARTAASPRYYIERASVYVRMAIATQPGVRP